MTDQQLAEAPEQEVIEQVQTEIDSETVSDTGENQEQKPTVSPEQNAAAEQAFKAREAKREAQALREENAALKAQIPVEARPTVPELDEFASAEDMQAWKTATEKQAKFDSGQELLLEKQQAEQNRLAQDEQAALLKKGKTYSSNATKLGVTPEELQLAGKVVATYLRPDLANAVLGDEIGPLISNYLSVNPEAIDSLNNADMLGVGPIFAEIKAKAAELKPKQSQAPEPAEQLDGGGAPQKQGGPPGVTYE